MFFFGSAISTTEVTCTVSVAIPATVLLRILSMQNILCSDLYAEFCNHHHRSNKHRFCCHLTHGHTAQILQAAFFVVSLGRVLQPPLIKYHTLCLFPPHELPTVSLRSLSTMSSAVVWTVSVANSPTVILHSLFRQSPLWSHCAEFSNHHSWNIMHHICFHHMNCPLPHSVVSPYRVLW